MVRDALVPDQDSAGLVSDAAGEILAFGDVVEEELEDAVGFLLVETDDAFGVDRVHIWSTSQSLT